MFDLVTYAPDEVIISEGVTDDQLYILQNGTVSVDKDGVHIADISEQGTFFGEIAAILGTPRSCTVKAKTECDILHLQQSLDDILISNPQLNRKLLNTMAERIASTTQGLADTHQLISIPAVTIKAE